MLKFTDAAIEKIKSITHHGNYLGLRLSMKKYGCSGMSYELDGVSQAEEGDIEITVGNEQSQTDVKFFIDPKAEALLIGTQMDYQQGVFDEGFVFSNPNEKGGCGCGKSFSFEEQ